MWLLSQHSTTTKDNKNTERWRLPYFFLFEFSLWKQLFFELWMLAWKSYVKLFITLQIYIFKEKNRWVQCYIHNFVGKKEILISNGKREKLTFNIIPEKKLMAYLNSSTGTFTEVHSFIHNFHCLATCGTGDKVFLKIEYGYVHKKNHLVVFVALSSRTTTLYVLFTCALTIYHVPKNV